MQPRASYLRSSPEIKTVAVARIMYFISRKTRDARVRDARGDVSGGFGRSFGLPGYWPFVLI